MFGAIVLDQTLSTAMPYEERLGREETPVHDRPRPFTIADTTPFVSYRESLPFHQKRTDISLTADDLVSDRDRPAADEASQQGNDEISRARDARLTLLERKYDGSASPEDVARFQLLTERIRKLMPRVTQQDFDTLNEMVESAESIAGTLASIRNEFGIR